MYKSIFDSFINPIIKALYKFGVIVDDVHHIKEKQTADDKGLIGYISQNL